MAYKEALADRIREALQHLPEVEEKKMFRGVTFMVDGKMCISVSAGNMMVRIDPAMSESLLASYDCKTMVMKNREYKGYLLVHEMALNDKQTFDFWIGQALAFNEHAKASKRKK